jgi:hypothetical protein
MATLRLLLVALAMSAVMGLLAAALLRRGEPTPGLLAAALPRRGEPTPRRGSGLAR